MNKKNFYSHWQSLRKNEYPVRKIGISEHGIQEGKMSSEWTVEVTVNLMFMIGSKWGMM